MKRLFALLCAAVLLCVCLCSCMDNAANKVKDKASEAASDVKDLMQGATDQPQVIETVSPTRAEDGDMMETIADMIASEYDDMVDNGEVDDGDGNVGEKEDHDGDGNAAPEN